MMSHSNRGFWIENLVNPLIDFLNFNLAKHGGVFQILTPVLALDSVVLIEIDVAVPVSFVTQSADCADHFALDGLRLTSGRNQ